MTNEFTWRKISDKEREDIKKQAKGIMDSFAKKLEKVEKEINDINVGIERSKSEREE